MARLQTTSVTGSLLVSTFISASSHVSASSFNTPGSMTAGSFSGPATGLTGIPATGITGILGSNYGGTGLNNANLAGKLGYFVTVNASANGYSATSITSTNLNVNVEAGGTTVDTPQSVATTADVTFAGITVNRSGSVGGANDSNYKFKVYGDLGVTGTVYETSTIKVKTNIETLTDELYKILQARPVEFDYIENGQHSYGFIAQELNEIYPDAVIKDETGETIGVAYADLTSPIIRAIQQLNEKIVLLENRVKELER